MPQEQLKNAREKKKAAKMRELNKKRINELTQGAAGIVRVKGKTFRGHSQECHEKRKRPAESNNAKPTVRSQQQVNANLKDQRGQVSQKAPVVAKAISSKRVVKLGTVVHLCGCRHGDLSVIKSFTKAKVAYYSRPNKFEA